MVTTTLGIDGLPLGFGAAVAAGPEIVAARSLSTPSGLPIDLEERVMAALRWAQREVGPIDEIRLVIVDDGDDGGRLVGIEKALAALGVVMIAVAPTGDAAPCGSGTDHHRSAIRAERAARGLGRRAP